MDELNDTIDVTPNPRILQMLGQIAFEPWQCLAELIDNSVDAYLTALGNSDTYLADVGLGEYVIHISLPNQHDYDAGCGRVSVRDTGPGMTLDEVNNSVRAGFSGNDPLGKLGLFGMGFNIATARLGRLTEIRTTRRDDDSWLVVKLDLDHMQETKQFRAKVSREDKDPEHRGAHGTIVEVHKLKNDFRGNLTSGGGRAGIRKKLSRIYSSLLSSNPISMKLENVEIAPFKHCHWDRSRTAIVGSGNEASCYLTIDQMLPDNYFCNVCWHWSSPDSVTNDQCPVCESKVALKERRVHGWLGIQRYFDEYHFGIDFIRNGRVIEQLNKDCFDWVNNEGEVETEYPIDTMHWGGRIIGQINIDFAAVDYQKTSFEKQQKEWQEVRDFIRGTTPLRPRIARELGYQANESPLGQLYNVFRSGNRPGRRMLVPGQKKAPSRGDNADSKAWAEKFFKGDDDFQTDDIWWERIELAERHARGEPSTPNDEPDNGGSLSDPFGEDDEAEDQEDVSVDDVEGTDHLRLDAELSLSYNFPGTSLSIAPIALTVYEDTRILRPRDFRDMQPLAIDTRQAPHRYTITYHPKHPAFHEFSETVDDYLLMELSSWFSIRAGGGEWTVSKIYKELKNTYQQGRKLDLRTLGQEATSLMGELKEHLAGCNISKSREDADPELLTQLEQEAMSTSGNIEDVDELLRDGRWIECVSDENIYDILHEDPGRIMDNNFFSTSYLNITNDDVRRDTLDRIINCLKDAIMIKKTAERQSAPEKQLLLRAHAALTYLTDQRA